MARVFITGSSDGLGLMAAKLLIEQGQDIVLHGRNDERCRDARAAAPGAKDTVVGDFSTIAGVKSVANRVNKLGRFNAVIHNAGIGYREPRHVDKESGVPSVFAINVLAPYILTALIERPDRLIYVSSGMHHVVHPRMDDLLWTKRPWNGAAAYAESKLCDVLLAFAVARRWKNVLSNALEPGWVPTKMVGASAPGDLFELARRFHGIRPRKLGSQQTPRWREVDSNHRSRLEGQGFFETAPVDVSALPFARERPNSRKRDRRFKSPVENRATCSLP
jgi:NAD(P)-dependent dehydrogenase (short-subunit alcohol dehydrogenase family)